jgi:hypothetical protein
MKSEEKDKQEGSSRNKSDSEYKKDQANGNLGDPTAKRNIGLGGQMSRPNQKDELENLHIQGNEATGYGANTEEPNENAQGPGFEAEGGEYHNDHTAKEE